MFQIKFVMALVMVMIIFKNVVEQKTCAVLIKVIVILMMTVVVTLSVAPIIVHHPFHQMLTVVKIP